MKELVIVGARGLGREVFSLAKECTGYNADFIVKGFVDDNSLALRGLPNYPPILSSLEEYKISGNDVFIVALGDTSWKKHYTEMIIDKGGTFHTLIHQGASLGVNTRIGHGTVLSRHVVLTTDVVLASHCYVGSSAIIGHDVKVGCYCHIGALCHLGGFSHLEDLVTLHPRSSILPNAKVERMATVGAGSVVFKRVKPGQTVFGIPAVPIT